jgi:polyhydroxybutyrate depolymerase
MKTKIIGICICMLLIATCVIPVCGTLSESKIKKTLVSPGDYLKVMVFGMRLRSYRIHVPPSYDGSNPMPLVVVLHGFPDNAHDIQSIGMNIEADNEGFIAVYPNGHTFWRDLSLYGQVYYGLWNLVYFHRWGYFYNCWDFDTVDDVGFIRTLIEKLQTTLEINSSRIYITGLSGGAFMTYRLGAELSDIVAAIAPVAGSIGGKWTVDSPLYTIPEPEHPLPVIIFHGMNDTAVPYNGDPNGTISVNDSVSFWVEHDQCDPTPQINISESGNIIKKTYANGSQGTEVVLYTVVDGHHGWFGGISFPYEYPCEISATDLIWDFFAAHPKQ